MPRIECNVEKFNWRPIKVFNSGPLKCSIVDPFNLESLEAKPMMMVDKEAHGMKAFLGLGPIVIF